MERTGNAKIMDGRCIADEMCRMHMRTALELSRRGLKPRLSIVMVGEEPASKLFVRNKVRYCEKVGVDTTVIHKPSTIDLEDLLETVKSLNDDPNINGILVQLPLPKHIDPYKIFSALDPDKDVDGLTPANLGRLMHGDEVLSPCGAKAVVKILEYYGVELEGAEICIVSNSILVGKPLSMILTNRFATISICHAKTKDLSSHTSNADILISATGVPLLIKASMIRDGAVVVDVGISKIEGRIAGDVDFDEVACKASMITPVPGGVGPVTVAMVVDNLFQAMKLQGVM
ncbi:MAG: bifunctional 5,10-methylenetetrahydrofolate dehydrogenase/5,10-methenyltetrahydrofolate cyclohydrolase [Nitrososphaerota archaeon]|nr:bifunctional 5,10-methylenetetrahydrofolate dehydrogenase/5,10-methenyltetrahydrofolate cyclohydrolase [Candidatus Bathyarchaeota archaeon]MDW8062014.1 bifunctional 5,10-methylenetetrahydrofolate dehydrogenase/5,10-methenyltetrahydrofolate cyclohydrolase [Nitrososphaerota archaeon]